MENKDTLASVLKEYLSDLKKWGLFYVPSFSFLMTLVFDKYDTSKEFAVGYLFSLFIGEIVFLFSITAGYLLSALEETIYEIAGKPAPVRTDVFHAIRSVFFLLPGLYIAFSALTHVAPLFGQTFNPPSIGNYKYGLMIGLAAIAGWILYDLYSGKKSSDERIHQLERDHLNAKIAALSAQMNPHLLFNALNTVAATIHDNPDAAESMTVELAGLYRKTLEATRCDFHTIASEIDIVRAYLTIEKARLDSRLNFTIDLGDLDCDVYEIPTLLLQPLVENAVKHGIAPKEHGGNIEIVLRVAGQKLTAKITDDGIGFGKSKLKGTGTGLENSKRRLNLIYGSQGEFVISAQKTEGTVVLVSLPLQRCNLDRQKV